MNRHTSEDLAYLRERGFTQTAEEIERLHKIEDEAKTMIENCVSLPEQEQAARQPQQQPVAKKKYRYHQPFPKKPRDGEVVGGGYFIFRRGNDTGRIRPSMWPYEHGSLEDAFTQARRLLEVQPDATFQIVSVVSTIRGDAQ